MIRQEVLMLFVQGTKKILKNNLSKLIVYGSYARGDYKENSDIDVMILTPLSKEEYCLRPYTFHLYRETAFRYHREPPHREVRP